MSDGLFIIVSTVPERISQYMLELQPFAGSFLFFSDVRSFLARQSLNNVKLIIIDNAGDDLNIVQQVGALRLEDAYRATTIFVITKEGDNDGGAAAMEAGSNDYLTLDRVGRELTSRVRVHMNSHAKLDEYLDTDCNLDAIYPLEDRLIIKNALWHIQKSLAFITNVSDLAFHVGRSAKDINRAFSLHLDQTASAYMRVFRIEKAKEMLAKTRLPISHIAQNVGYSSAANFSTAFKSTVGLSPVQYRTQNLSA